ncbi:hypothetical protein L7F22_052169 [Adiantum nelumboides]|nr:hypothetical protein [Adiantum nelumboides]
MGQEIQGSDILKMMDLSVSSSTKEEFQQEEKDARDMVEKTKEARKCAMKRKDFGIWSCKDCNKINVGGAYTLSIVSAIIIHSTIRCLRKQVEG